MNDYAQGIVDKEKKERTGRLDLGRCGLTEIPEEVWTGMPWLRWLSMSNRYWDYSLGVGTRVNSTNPWPKNNLTHLPRNQSQLPNLRDLIIAGDFIGDYFDLADLSAIRNLSRLKTLDCSHTLIDTLEPLESLTYLHSLDCSHTQISDLKPIQSLSHLRSLTFSHTGVSDLEPIENLSKLQSLVCRNTPIYNLEPIQNLHFLESINFSRTSVKSLEPILPILKGTRLQSLVLNRCPLILPPLNIAVKGIEAILSFFQEYYDDKEKTNAIQTELISLLIRLTQYNSDEKVPKNWVLPFKKLHLLSWELDQWSPGKEISSAFAIIGQYQPELTDFSFYRNNFHDWGPDAVQETVPERILVGPNGEKISEKNVFRQLIPAVSKILQKDNSMQLAILDEGASPTLPIVLHIETGNIATNSVTLKNTLYDFEAMLYSFIRNFSPINNMKMEVGAVKKGSLEIWLNLVLNGVKDVAPILTVLNFFWSWIKATVGASKSIDPQIENKLPRQNTGPKVEIDEDEDINKSSIPSPDQHVQLMINKYLGSAYKLIVEGKGRITLFLQETGQTIYSFDYKDLEKVSHLEKYLNQKIEFHAKEIITFLDGYTRGRFIKILFNARPIKAYLFDSRFEQSELIEGNDYKASLDRTLERNSIFDQFIESGWIVRNIEPI
jgi:hypothetical protein